MAPISRRLALATSLVAAIACIPGAAVAPSRIRRPVALVTSSDGARVFVANERSGTLSVIDPARDAVVLEEPIGQGLVDLAWHPDQRHLIVVDRPASQVRVVDTQGGRLKPGASIVVARDPVSLCVFGTAPDARLAVASLGARAVTVLDLSVTSPPRLQRLRTIGLPFEPRRMAWLGAAPAARLVVADAHGGALAVVAPERGTIEAVHSLPGHNLRGLAVSTDGRWLVVAHQVLERTAATTFDNVHFGALMRNNLLVLPVSTVLRARNNTELLAESRVADLEGFGNGGGDPAGVAFDRDGGVVVALSGVGEVGLSAAPTGQLRRVRTGIRPTAVAIRPDARAAYVADTAGDAVWVVELPGGLRRHAISLGPRPEPDGVERGERLFYDARLSHDHWLSCQSCHTDGHTNGRLADTISDGSYGTPKRVLSLLGVGATGPWAWNGGSTRLEDQVRKSVTLTMQGDPLTDAQVADLTAFLRSLPPPSPGDAEAPAAVSRGRAVFEARRCDRCHAPPEYTAARSFDVDLPDEAGQRLFNPPSLRGVGTRSPLLHDGRATTLEDVFQSVHHPRGETLKPHEIADLIAFLRTL